MKLPRPRPIDRQAKLFKTDKLLRSKGEARWAVGEFFEQAVADVSGGVRLKTDCNADICPDIQFDDVTYGEAKGCGRNGSVIFYEHRYEKDQRFMRETGNEIIYWFWQHSYPALDAGSYDELNAGLAVNTKRLLVVDAGLLTRAVALKEPRIVNSGYTANGDATGYGKRGTGIGWTMRLSFFAENSVLVPIPLLVNVFGSHSVKAEVFVSKPEFKKYLFQPQVQRRLDFNLS